MRCPKCRTPGLAEADFPSNGVDRYGKPRRRLSECNTCRAKRLRERRLEGSKICPGCQRERALARFPLVTRGDTTRRGDCCIWCVAWAIPYHRVEMVMERAYRLPRARWSPRLVALHAARVRRFFVRRTRWETRVFQRRRSA